MCGAPPDKGTLRGAPRAFTSPRRARVPSARGMSSRAPPGSPPSAADDAPSSSVTEYHRAVSIRRTTRRRTARVAHGGHGAPARGGLLPGYAIRAFPSPRAIPPCASRSRDARARFASPPRHRSRFVARRGRPPLLRRPSSLTHPASPPPPFVNTPLRFSRAHPTLRQPRAFPRPRLVQPPPPPRRRRGPVKLTPEERREKAARFLQRSFRSRRGPMRGRRVPRSPSTRPTPIPTTPRRRPASSTAWTRTTPRSRSRPRGAGRGARRPGTREDPGRRDGVGRISTPDGNAETSSP